jgi:hypothetical protein
MRQGAAFLLVLSMAACSKPPSAAAVCEKLVAAGVATNCKQGELGEGLVSAASDRAVFDLPSVPGETGQVVCFDKSADYDATVKAFDAMAALAGRHRYGSPSARVFVQLNSQAPAETGTKAEAVVEGL